jgi:hypothetical protein
MDTHGRKKEDLFIGYPAGLIVILIENFDFI